MREENYTFEDMAVILPEHWREKAKELGALQRAREIKTPEDLLKLIFLYLTEGKSFGSTSALLRMSESYHLTKKASIPGCVIAWSDSKSPLVEMAVRESVSGEPDAGRKTGMARGEEGISGRCQR
jgi:hypothetical protein